ncbi:hypothetical protein ACDQ55_21115 [Chitinophaga sp. 30R24]|uniref:hypothetical protein n=1 Tax=Chitinophaga sp. 30R24 TaxID=3248838 RepID=UPI003B8F950C
MKRLAIMFVILVSSIQSTTVVTVPLWGQCGGIGYTGATTCESGATCIKQNDFYYQCQPKY